jgi:hypothetical protein
LFCCCSYICCDRNMHTVPLPCSDHVSWLCYSTFWVSCHNMNFLLTSCRTALPHLKFWISTSGLIYKHGKECAQRYDGIQCNHDRMSSLANNKNFTVAAQIISIANFLTLHIQNILHKIRGFSPHFRHYEQFVSGHNNNSTANPTSRPLHSRFTYWQLNTGHFNTEFI